MLTVLLACISGFLVARFAFNANVFSEDMIFAELFSFAIGLITANLVGGSITSKVEGKIKTETLVFLRGSVHTTGDFFLGSGTINSAPYYFYYTQSEDGGYQLKKMRADNDNVLVYEENRSDGVMETYMRQLGAIHMLWGFADDENIYKFRIPTGSIKRGFAPN